MSYWRFAAMIATSTVTMFVLMYLNTYALEHLYFSETRTYMAILMGSTMAIIMLAFMLSMYSSKALNAAIFVGAAIVFAVSLWLVRSQETVQDQSFMRAMIPHHSIAIMTSQRAEITDARAAKLAREIELAQNREIAEMRYLVAEIGREGEIDSIYEDPPPRVGSLQEALNATRIATLDPAPISLENLPEGTPTEALDCGFRRVASEEPILRANDDGALMNLNGVIVPLERREGASPRIYEAPGVTMTLQAVEDADWRGDTDLIFALEEGLTVGYRGFSDCAL